VGHRGHEFLDHGFHENLKAKDAAEYQSHHNQHDDHAPGHSTLSPALVADLLPPAAHVARVGAVWNRKDEISFLGSAGTPPRPLTEPFGQFYDG
jgi:hypothetical protein